MRGILIGLSTGKTTGNGIVNLTEVVHTGVSKSTGPKNLGLVQEEKEIGKPDIQSYTVEVPGRNGLLNLTKALTGRVMYSNRELKFRYFGSGSRAELLALDEAMTRYHGETVIIIDDDYPDYYYEGEATVSTEYGSNYVLISLKVDAQPFRMKNIFSGSTQTLTSSQTTVTVTNGGVEVVPTISVTGEATISFNGVTVHLTDGTYIVEKFVLSRGENTFTAYGDGKLSITYREGTI